MPYVSVRLTDGPGNRLFQVAAALGCAEKYGLTPVFVAGESSTNKHGDIDVRKLFPEIPTITRRDGAWRDIREGAADCFRYVPFPAPREGESIFLRGYFQSERYFPSRVPISLNAEGVRGNLEDAVFLHVRRGDYLNPACAHHCINLRAYCERCLGMFTDCSRVVVCSDDMAWCRRELPSRYGHLVRPDQWLWCEGDELSTLATMAVCGRGGICANSTFSWWGAYLGHCRGVTGAVYCMPESWGRPPLPPAVDIWPEWVVRVPT